MCSKTLCGIKKQHVPQVGTNARPEQQYRRTGRDAGHVRNTLLRDIRRKRPRSGLQPKYTAVHSAPLRERTSDFKKKDRGKGPLADPLSPEKARCGTRRQPSSRAHTMPTGTPYSRKGQKVRRRMDPSCPIMPSTAHAATILWMQIMLPMAPPVAWAAMMM